ncbi:MAG: hypothetical protein NVSMB9_07730 [Isosphaeraceae bacterium]
MQPAGWRGRLAQLLGALGRVVMVSALGLTTAAGAARGADEVEVENLRVGFADATRANLFKVGTWTPVWIQLKGGGQGFSGTLEVEVPDDEGTPTYFRQAIDVPARGSVRTVTYARPGSRDPNFLIRLRDARGRLHGKVVDGSGLAQLSPLFPAEALLLTLGKPQGVDQVPDLPGLKNDSNTSGTGVSVARIDAIGDLLPGRWYGFDAANTIVVDTNDKDLMEALSIRGQALVDWVARGGHMVVAVGGNWQSVRDSVLATVLPAVPVGQESLGSLESLESYAGASKPIVPTGSPKVSVTRLEQVESRGGKVLSATGDLPLLVRGYHGFGRVTLVALDVDQKPFAEWPDRALFWLKAMDFHRRAANASETTVRISGGGQALYQSGVNDLASQLRQALEQFPGVKLIPFGWVAFFIFVYILLIGPGDYLFLKKVVKRMELTWVTFPLIVLTVSLVSYFAAYMVKGKELRVNKIDVVDLDQSSGQSRGSTFVNMFSPQNRDYNVSVIPLALDRDPPPAEPGGSTSATIDPPKAGRPPAGTEVLLTWLGVPESGFGGMGNSGRVGFSGGGYTSLPSGGSETLEGVRVPIWSTKLLTARWFGPAANLIESDLLPVGSDRLSGTVTSTLDVPLNDAILAFGKHVYILGTLPARGTMRVELAPDRQLSGLLKSRYAGAVPEGSARGNKIVRSDLALALMFHDSQGASTTDQPLASEPLGYLDLTGQLALDRPMLVGRIDRPAALLVLGNASAPPRVEQTTMLRVILPLGKIVEEAEKPRKREKAKTNLKRQGTKAEGG